MPSHAGHSAPTTVLAAQHVNKVPSHAGHSAFTLVETVLALVAIGIALIGLFGLGRIGLESSREAENDRRCTMMADAVFETLRAVNEVFVAEARTNGFTLGQVDGTSFTQAELWYLLWQQGGDEGTGVPPLPDPLPIALWGETAEGVRLLFPPIAGMCTNNVPLLYSVQTMSWNLVNTWEAYDPNNISLADWNPRYYLNIGRMPTYRYYSPVSGTYSAMQVTLLIWPDGNVASSDPRIFTTILSNSGGMQ
ncbi:MAG: hypothetical protein FWH21_03230 [Kiritimatiellaeota bacterium]|nr:hypothetical protein [Kiritimatiellota bacterium]